jgi:phenylacetate-coenzyme A ligase PaaK-like adenylate-forming protein
MQSTERLRDKYFVAATSGSTGRRGFFVWDDHEWATVMASYARSQDWAGVPAKLTRRMKMAVVSSKTPWHQSAVVGATAHSPFVPTLRLDAKEPTEKLDAELDAFRPEVLVGYASMMRLLADERAEGRLHIAPRAIFCASEVLTDESRRKIERAFGTTPFNVYAATETAGIASDCERHRMHLFEDLVITEIVDDQNRPVPPGEFGAKVLVTVLFSRTLPLIRYEMSDCPRASAEACSCGRPFALIDGIEGRREDVIELPAMAGGNLVSVHPNTFHDVLDLVPAKAWQVVAEPSRLRVLVVGLPGNYNRRELLEKIVHALLARGTSPDVVVEDVDEIPRSALGKTPLIRRASP